MILPAPPTLSPDRRRMAWPFPRAAAAVALLAALPAAAGAQTWRSLESSRQLRDSSPVAVRVEYGAGQLAVLPATEPVLYRMELRYDAEHDRPVHEFDAGQRRLDLGLRPGTMRVVRSARGGDMRLELARGVPLDLKLDVGAVRSEVDLRGLTLDRLSLNTGASETRVRFDSTGGRPPRRIEVDAGAAQVELLDLASVGGGVIELEVGVGSMDVDLGRVWRGDVELDVQAALGAMTLRVPREVGIRLDLDRTLAGFEHDGLSRQGDNVWLTDNWETAPRKLRVRAETTLGKLRIQRY